LEGNGDWQQQSVDERRLRYLVSWSPQELPVYIKRWGIDNWIPKYYLHVNAISLVEYALFVLAVFLLVRTLL